MPPPLFRAASLGSPALHVGAWMEITICRSVRRRDKRWPLQRWSTVFLESRTHPHGYCPYYFSAWPVACFGFGFRAAVAGRSALRPDQADIRRIAGKRARAPGDARTHVLAVARVCLGARIRLPLSDPPLPHAGDFGRFGVASNAHARS